MARGEWETAEYNGGKPMMQLSLELGSVRPSQTPGSLGARVPWYTWGCMRLMLCVCRACHA